MNVRVDCECVAVEVNDVCPLIVVVVGPSLLVRGKGTPNPLELMFSFGSIFDDVLFLSGGRRTDVEEFEFGWMVDSTHFFDMVFEENVEPFFTTGFPV